MGAGQAGRVEWGHELRGVELELDEILTMRRSVLTARGMDALPANSLAEAVSEAWAVSSEAEAERTLLSFAAAASLSPEERLVALGMSDLTERLTHVISALRTQERKLAAQSAVQQAIS